MINKWKRILLLAVLVLAAFFAGIVVSSKLNWRVFVLHDSERVTIKVK